MSSVSCFQLYSHTKKECIVGPVYQMPYKDISPNIHNLTNVVLSLVWFTIGFSHQCFPTLSHPYWRLCGLYGDKYLINSLLIDTRNFDVLLSGLALWVTTINYYNQHCHNVEGGYFEDLLTNRCVILAYCLSCAYTFRTHGEEAHAQRFALKSASATRDIVGEDGRGQGHICHQKCGKIYRRVDVRSWYSVIFIKKRLKYNWIASWVHEKK